MKNYSKINKKARTVIVLCVAAIATFTACVKTDDTLGGGFIPDDQELVIDSKTIMAIEDAANMFETRLFQSDSLVTSNLANFYFGTSQNDTMGMRSVGYMAQYMSYYDEVDSGYFGYKPIFDSIQIILSVTDYGRDTVTPQTFHVYEVTSNKYFEENKNSDGELDSVFYLNFDVNKFFENNNFEAQTPLFTFEYPSKQANVNAPTALITMKPTAQGLNYVKRLMISDGDNLIDPDVDYSIYDDAKEWLEAFKGLYVAPEKTTWVPSESKGNIYSANVIPSKAYASTGFKIYARSRDQSDPTLIKDTLTANYYPFNAETGDILQSINTIKHDYTNSQIIIADAVETNLDRPINNDIYVDGLGGVTTEITLTQNFFDSLEKIIEQKNSSMDENFTTLAFNKAELSIYFSAGDYDWGQIISGDITPQINSSMVRLGLYSNYTTLTNIPDYNYIHENNGNDIPYGGYVNRSQGRYQMNINGYMQGVWNSYLKEKESSSDGVVDLTKIKGHKIYLAPAANSRFTTTQTKAQGMENFAGKENKMKLELIYTLVK